MVLWLVRHGETAFNVEGRVQGGADSPLTERGVEQAHAVGRLLAELTRDTSGRVLWTSPLGRTRRTAAIIQAAMGLADPPREEPRLAELSLGLWDGMVDEEIEFVSPGRRDGSTRYDWYFRSPDGEALSAIQARLRHWLAEAQVEQGCHIAVSHGLSGRILRGCYTGLPDAQALCLEVPQDAVFRLEGGKVERFAA